MSQIAGGTGNFGQTAIARARRSPGRKSRIEVMPARPTTAHSLAGLTLAGQIGGLLANVVSPPLTVNWIDLLIVSAVTVLPAPFWKLAPAEPWAVPPLDLIETATLTTSLTSSSFTLP